MFYSSKKRGFTLLEMLLGMIIFATAAAGISGTVIQSQRISKGNRNCELAFYVGSGIVNQIKMMSYTELKTIIDDPNINSVAFVGTAQNITRSNDILDMNVNLPLDTETLISIPLDENESFDIFVTLNLRDLYTNPIENPMNAILVSLNVRYATKYLRSNKMLEPFSIKALKLNLS